MKYKRRSIEVDAVQITDEWFDGDHPNPLHPSGITIDPVKRQIEITSGHKDEIGKVGDWVVTPIDSSGGKHIVAAVPFADNYDELVEKDPLVQMKLDKDTLVLWYDDHGKLVGKLPDGGSILIYSQTEA